MISSVVVLATFFAAIVQAKPFTQPGGIGSRKLSGSSFGVPGNASYDYVVVGGGNAGLTIATRLAEDSRVSVAIVEAGSFYEIENGNLSQIPAYDTKWTGKDLQDVNRVDWGFATVPQKVRIWRGRTYRRSRSVDNNFQELLDAKVHYARGKALGGCTARNYMAYHRGTEGTYKKWADQVGDDSYNLENFGHYFEKSLNFTKPKESRAANASAEYDLSTMGKGDGPLSITFSN